ncbi:ferrous iron transport protein B [Syntrophotalea carbinolica DSM 2380]|uniref:Ferrous iron transport protein B n=1 Tax=Syntrophotalea carbinolica (strain DSM 2380 / NBRC 103641 / GraBd1) TaxID=338963 RepID=Q3A670_SYNC1|nr:ferrous iron transport protein B [Syntrophotalea carbinolica]ABA88137.1 ferrous iron transport protein B [Syntrophotalea carbinolica DSM 2380]
MSTGTTIALAGNPNSGKTTLFNALTGARQHVGNYPGVTVERKEGSFIGEGQTFRLIDLPGMYSLTAYSLEELVARDFLVQEKPAAIVNIIDASNLERNLYLTVQFMELGLPVCIALNMVDAAQNRGIEIDAPKLSELMGIPVIPTIARSGQGKAELMQATGEMIDTVELSPPLIISYGEDIDQALAEMECEIADALPEASYPSRWLALKFLENDDQILEYCQRENADLCARLKSIRERVSQHISTTLATCPEAVIADHRYGYIKAIIKQGIITHHHDRNRLFLSDHIDRVLTNRFAGPLIMIAVIMALYQFTFTYSETPVAWLESLFGWLGGMVDANMPDGLLKSLIISGVIDGAGGVLGFAPIIMFMFFGIALLEDSGYLARVAFMLDRVFRSFGLHGASVMPFIVSGGIAGGCAVPGVMATRTLKSPRERLATLLTAPFMNCGAKLPVFALLVGAFFAKYQAQVMLIITMIAWAGALLAAKLLRSTVIKGESTPFVMELPPYRMPTFRGLLIHTWERTWQYVKKAGTIILGISILLWAMMTFPGLPEAQQQSFDLQRAGVTALAPADLEEQLNVIDAKQAETALRYSIAGKIGTSMENVTKFAGFNWRTNIALVGGFAAKEVVVSTLGTAYSLGEVDPEDTNSLGATLAKSPEWNPVVAFSLIVFTIFYAPCFVTVVCIAREAGSWKWGVFSIVFNTSIAFSLAVLSYQIGSAGIFGI